ncbi:hypothetical protein E2562_024090 [Oryza meyeriana var. granulata]|uniref:Uncharacterized protein n=1 Tax=Oryza meyeriana var. granulata TaxID=110450 RepID=A0A6G1CIB2_9ORYZ|nr:hypothetical protein E2562_024090 [Oryza meyeriana var. granulata]
MTSPSVGAGIGEEGRVVKEYLMRRRTGLKAGAVGEGRERRFGGDGVELRSCGDGVELRSPGFDHLVCEEETSGSLKKSAATIFMREREEITGGLRARGRIARAKLTIFGV